MTAATMLFEYLLRACREERSTLQGRNAKHVPSQQPHMPRHTLDTLHPKPVVPWRNTKRGSDPVAALERVEFVEVTKISGRPGFSLHIYERDPQTRIPVRGQYSRFRQWTEARKRVNATPSRTIHVEFDEFLRLRYDAYEIARASHVRQSCSCCHHAIFLNSASSVRPRWLTRWFQSDAKECRMLTAYLNAMLELVRQIPGCGDDQFCRGREQLPRLLQILLRSYEPQQ